MQPRDINSPIICLEIEANKVNVFMETGSKVSLVLETIAKRFSGVQIRSCNTRITSLTHDVLPVLGEYI